MVSRAELARQLGVSAARITHAVDAGKIAPEPGTKQMHLLRACQDIVDNTPDTTSKIYQGAQRLLGIHALTQDIAEAETPAAPGTGGQILSFASARARKEHYAALTAELAYQERVGELLPACEVEGAAAEAGRLVRDALMAIPDRCAALLAAEPDTNKAHELLLSEIEQALESL